MLPHNGENSSLLTETGLGEMRGQSHFAVIGKIVNLMAMQTVHALRPHGIAVGNDAGAAFVKHVRDKKRSDYRPFNRMDGLPSAP